MTEATAPFAYRWTKPTFRAGDRVMFRWHARLWKAGEVGRVETHYRADGEARHSYHVRTEGRAEGRWVWRWVAAEDMRLIGAS